MKNVAELGLAAALLGALFATAPLAGHPAMAAAAAPSVSSPASALPEGHLALGVSAQPPDLAPGGWMPSTGVPWDYSTQYLDGGVNTGAGWQTWNANAAFPVMYEQSARALGYIPLFAYYMLRQSDGPCGTCSEAEVDISNLNDSSVMAAYYADFITLMKRLGPGSYGGPVVIDVEPDLSGYAEQAVTTPSEHCFGYCTGGDVNPSNLDASVADTGVEQAAAFPNTYQGFNDTLLHIRDLYAPNVALGFHVSGWATEYDVGSYTATDIDFGAKGQEAGTFADASGVQTSAPGVSTYDVVFNDVADNDSGRSGIWWDRTNRTLPDFARWETYVSGIHAVTGKGVIIWQIPVGNQWFDTENNTSGHYQDNRVEYFLSHPAELVAAGITGLTFGAGNPGDTTPMDTDDDGVTNPPAICTTNGMGGGQICNNHTSTVSDDDGGYLRMAGAAYYANPAPLNPTGSSPGSGPAAGGPFWMAAANGSVLTGGTGTFLGSPSQMAAPIVGMAATPSGRGYWLVGSDGGIFSFGDAVFAGSTGGIHLNQPIVGMAATPSGHGYWLAASDGGIFSFGDGRFFGSGAGRTMRAVGIAGDASGGGYWIAGSDGSAAAFGNASPSTGPVTLGAPAVGIATITA